MKIPNHVLAILDSIYGTSIVKKYQFYQKFQYWSRDRIDEFVNNRIKETIINAYRNVPYYTELFNNYSINIETNYPKEEIKLIPVLTKKIIRSNYHKLKSNKPINSYEEGSSGSTGEHANFRITRNMESWFIAGQLLSYSWGGFYLGYPYILSGVSRNRILKKRIKDWITKCYYIPAFSITNLDIQGMIEIIKKNKIKYIISYSSTLALIAEYLIENNISVNSMTVFSHGENLRDSWREKIKSGFGNYPIDGWGTSGEALLLASQCEERGLYHLFEANTFLSYRNGQGDIVEPYVTTLTNSVMPLINYKVGDLIEIADNECSCGKRLKTIKGVLGRDTDVITTKSGRKLVTHLFTGLFEYANSIKYFQVTQEKIDSIKLLIVKKDNFKTEELDYVINKIKEASANELKIDYFFAKEIPKEKSGKRRILKSTIPYFNNH